MTEATGLDSPSMFDFLVKLFSAPKPAPPALPDLDSLKITPADIGIPPTLTPARTAAIAAKLTDYLRVNGANLPADRIPALQQRIQDLAFAGMRSKGTAQKLQAEFGLDEEQAKRVATIGTKLVMAKYHELQAREIGFKRYTWSTSGDCRVCPRCQALHGRIFSWDNPPQGGHPGECLTCADPAGCRCVARPVIDFD